MTARTNKFSNLKHKKLIITISIIMAVIILIISGYFIILKIGEIILRNKLSSNKPQIPVGESSDLINDADTYYNGSAYNYDSNLINILLIGVDKNNVDISGNHQADAIYLISLDPDVNIVNVIGVSRNTIAEIDIFDINGKYFSSDKRQICLSYSFGENDNQSSELTVKAVSKLLYGIPINGYYTVFMDSISDIVNAVGGVPVHIDEDMTSISPKFTTGSDVVISGDKALSYLRFRKELSEPRFQRQKTFIASFVSRAKTAVLRDLSLPLKMYNKLSKNTVTDVGATSAVYLASEAVEANFQFHNVAGAVGFDGTYETFEVDDAQLYQLVLDVFYKKQ